MGFCKHCGSQLEDGVKFCSGCGSPVQAPSSQPVSGGGAPQGGFQGSLPNQAPGGGAPQGGFQGSLPNQAPGGGAPQGGFQGSIPSGTPVKQKKKGNVGLIIGIIAGVGILLILLLATLFMLVLPKLGGNKNSEKMQGFYFISHAYQDGEEFTYDDLDMQGYEEYYLEITEKGKGNLYFFTEGEEALTWNAKEIKFGGGSYPYTFDEAEEILTLDFDGAEWVFTKIVPVSYGKGEGGTGATGEAVLEIVYPSIWVGYAKYTNYKGVAGKSASDEEMVDITAVFGKESESGRNFFEIYEDDSDDEFPILSIWTLEDSAFLLPDSEQDDNAWIFDMDLDGVAAADFSSFLAHDKISIVYHYDDGSKSFDCEFVLKEETSPWDKSVEEVPPSLQ